MSRLRFLCFPWLAGHGCLYACAHVTAVARREARVAMTQRSLATLGDGQTDQALLAIFQTFDTSGDGALDSNELKVALRKALGIDLSHDDCVRLVQVADVKGTGTVDFDEFRAIVRQRL